LAETCQPWLITHGVHPLWGVKQLWGGENKLFSSKMRQYHSPDGADGCCITTNKSLTCLQLVRIGAIFDMLFASHWFVSDSWAFLLFINIIVCYSSYPLATIKNKLNKLI